MSEVPLYSRDSGGVWGLNSRMSGFSDLRVERSGVGGASTVFRSAELPRPLAAAPPPPPLLPKIEADTNSGSLPGEAGATSKIFRTYT